MGRSFIELGDDGIKLLEAKALIGRSSAVNGCIMHHLEQIIISQILMQLLGNSFEFLKVHNSILILVVNGKHSANSVFGFCFSNL